MKNLNKVLAVVIALTMIMGTVVFAGSFSDVADDAAYAEPIEVGVALGLFTGYEDGTFKSDGDITRAEFAAIVVRALGQATQADGAKGSTGFTDVPSDHWAAGYINIAASQKIVNGYGDGTFGPEDKVTYEQAVKMLVVALGYEPAVGSAGYPVGYLTIAQQNSMTNNVKGTNGVAINRGQVAQLVFNSLDVPLMEQTGFGTYIDYVIQDGSGDTYKKTIMSEKLGVVKLRAIVDKSYELDSNKKSNLVKVEIVNAYSSKYADVDYDDDKIFAKGEKIDVQVGSTNLKGLVGAQVVLYMSYDESSDDDPVALYAARYVSGSDTLTVSYSDIDDRDNLAIVGDDITIDYYETETATKTTSFTLAKTANVYVNGYALSADTKVQNAPATDIVTVLKNFYGNAIFSLENSASTADYDTVFVNDYISMIVTDNNTTSGRVTGDGIVSSVIYNPTNTQHSSTLVDKDGKVLDWSVLKEDDVLSIQQAAKNSRYVTTAILVSDMVTGTVTEIGMDGDENEYKIGDKTYKVNQTMFSSLGLKNLALEDEGDFYLDIIGRIVNFNVSSTVSHNYAFVLATAPGGGIDDTAQIKLFTYSGEIVTLDCAQKIRLTKDFDTTDEDDETTTESSVDSKKLVSTAPADAAYKMNANDFITFGTNSSGKISKIAYAEVSTDDSGTKFTQYATAANGSYDYSDERFKVGGKNIYVTESTVIMQAPTVVDTTYTEDDYELISISAFSDDQNIASAIKAFDVDKNGNASAILINGIVEIDSAANGLAMIVKLAQAKNDAGDTIDKATVLQNANSKDFSTIELLGSSDPKKELSDLAEASVFAPKFNSKGEVNDYTLIAELIANPVLDPLAANNDEDDYITFTLPGNTDKVEYFKGEVKSRKGTRITLTDDSDFNILSSTNVYVYADKGSSAATRVYAPDIRYNAFSSDSQGNLTDSDGDDLEKVFVLVREYDDKVADVIFYMFE